MKKALSTILTAFAMLTSGFTTAIAADVSDRIVAVVGNEVILKSEVDERELMVHAQFPDSRKDPELRKHLLENLVDQKILLTKAKIDSVKVDDSAINSMVTDRFASIRAGFPSARDMEVRFGKPVSRIKQDIRDDIREQQMVDSLRRKHIKDVTVSYEEVMEFYRKEKDQLPMMPEAVSVSQIIKYPLYSDAARADALTRIRDVQRRLQAGEDFASLANSLSDDPGSRSLGGDLGFVQKGELVPSFEAAAYALKPGQVSAPVETRFGFHIIQTLEKEGTSVHVRHILAMFDRNQRDVSKTLELLKGLRGEILAGKTTFAAIAEKYSDDPMSAKLGGLLKSAGPGGSMFEISSLKPDLQKIISSLKKAGEVSVPEPITPEKGDPFVAMFQLNSRTPAHRLTPEQDFTKLEELAGDEKRKQLFTGWLDQLKKEVLVRIMP
ncbi:MAG: peptidylprolyl isomerase [Chlorobiaceae bacterium]|nr:peptidylprolyl isomerase [Chlorobiaceae bacterium]